MEQFILHLLIKNFFDIYIMLLLLRIWWLFINGYNDNEFIQFIVKITNPFLNLLHYRPIYNNKFIKSIIIIIIAYLLSISKVLLIKWLNLRFLFITPEIIFIIGLLTLFKLFGILIFGFIVSSFLIRSNSRNEVVDPLINSILNPLRNIIPTFWNIDFSPIIVLTILFLINYLVGYFFPIIWSFVKLN